MFLATAPLEICTKIQYNAGMEPVLDSERVRREMEVLGQRMERKISLPMLAEIARVNYNTLYKAVEGKSTDKERRVSAELVARLAITFGCSMEYLMGLSEKREPVALDLSEQLLGVVAVTKALPTARQRDLLKIAQVWAASAEQEKHQLLSDIEDTILGVADKMGRGDELDRKLAERLKEWLNGKKDSDSPDPDDDSDDDTGGGEEPPQE